MHSIVEVQLTDFDVVVPNVNRVPPLPGTKPAPVTVTLVPPVVDPALGLRLATVGVNVKWSLDEVALVPFGVVTVTSTVPTDSVGDVAVTELDELTVKPVAAEAPNLTAVAPVRLAPVIVTTVPPVAGPLAGLTRKTAGRGR